MTLIYMGLVAVLLIIAVIFKSMKMKGAGESSFPYRKQRAIFTAPESSYYNLLRQAAGANILIFGKVRVANIIAPNKGMTDRQWKNAFGKITAEHFDFVLCDIKTHAVLCVIDFNGHPSESKKRKEHDAFLKGACESVQIPLIQVKVGVNYTVDDIQKTLIAHLPNLKNTLLQSRKAMNQEVLKKSKETLLVSNAS